MVSTYFKYFVLIFIVTIISIICLVFALLTFQYAGIIAGSIVTLILAGCIIAIIFKFASTGLENMTFEEQVARDGKKFVRQVIVRDTDNNMEWFSEKGQMVATQRGVYFFYGFPYFFGHKCLIINTLTNEEMSANPIIIEGAAPQEYPNQKYIETIHAIKVKGAINDWAEQKAYDAGLSLVKEYGKGIRQAVAGNPDALKKNMSSNISVDDLLKQEF
jgi:hypothetical protein